MMCTYTIRTCNVTAPLRSLSVCVWESSPAQGHLRHVPSDVRCWLPHPEDKMGMMNVKLFPKDFRCHLSTQ